MGMSYTIDAVRALVVTRVWDTFSNDDLRDGISHLMADPRFDPCYRSLVDMREVTAITAAAPVLAQVARTPLFAVEARRAIVAESDLAFGVARMYATYADAEGASIRVFREMSEAESWLGLGQDESGRRETD
jgi:hypothetical protein